MQPIEQCQSGPASLLVVSVDLSKELVILAFAPVLVVDDRFHAGAHGSYARERKERFQSLKRITRDPRSQGLTKNAVKIDEYFPPEKIIDFGFAGRIAAHQLLDRALFVGAEVVHVKIGIARQARMNQVDKGFERTTFFDVIVRPEWLIARFISVDGVNAKHKSESAR